jgi:hypothetical protein
VRLGVVFTTSLAALVVAAGSQAAGSAQPLRFSTVIHSTDFEVAAGPTGAFAYAAGRAIEWVRQAPGVRTTPTTPLTTVPFESVSSSDQAKLDAVDYRRFFVVLVAIVRPTAGYTITIRRVSVDPRPRQLCIVATIRRPSAAVAPRKSNAFHAVRIARGKLGLNIPEGVVLRDQSSALQYATPHKTRPAACRR